MKIKVWHRAGEHKFSCVCNGIAEAYDAICSMTNACAFVVDYDDTMRDLVHMAEHDVFGGVKHYSGMWGYEKVEERT